MVLRILGLLLLAVFVVLGASVGYFNAQTVELDYLAGKLSLPLIALVIGEFVVVVLLTLLICMGRMLALKAEIRRLRKQVRSTDAEIKSLREIPFKDA